MKARKLIIIIASSIFALASTAAIAYAAYKFVRQVSTTTDVGQIAVSNKGFIDFSVDASTGTTAEKELKSKLRIDTLLYVDGITLAEKTDPSNSNQTIAHSIESISVCCTGNAVSVTPTITKTNDTTGTIVADGVTYSYTIDGSNKKLTSVTTEAEGRTINLHTDGLGFVVTDSNYIENNKSTLISSVMKNGENTINQITVSGTELKYNSSDKLYLNQIGCAFEFTPEVACYVRIHFEDAWIRYRQYASTTRTNYIVKGEIEGASPFSIIDDNWIYDSVENTAYYKNMFTPSKNAEGNYEKQQFIFTLNPAYFYIGSYNSSYKDYIDIEVSFMVDAIQANRAYEVWGKDPLTFNTQS